MVFINNLLILYFKPVLPYKLNVKSMLSHKLHWQVAILVSVGVWATHKTHLYIVPLFLPCRVKQPLKKDFKYLRFYTNLKPLIWEQPIIFYWNLFERHFVLNGRCWRQPLTKCQLVEVKQLVNFGRPPFCGQGCCRNLL